MNGLGLDDWLDRRSRTPGIHVRRTFGWAWTFPGSRPCRRRPGTENPHLWMDVTYAAAT